MTVFASTLPFICASTLTSAMPEAKLIRAPWPASTPRSRRRRRIIWSVLLLVAAFAGLVAHYNVDKTLTDEDRHYIRLLLPGLVEGSAANQSYEYQVALVARAQKALLTHSPVVLQRGIPEGQLREPKQFYLSRRGLCYDRSRVLEKIFTYVGLQSRHVSMFAREEGVNPLITVLFHHVSSHAVSEVRTAKGWMLVDSIAPWLGLDESNNPVSVREMVNRHDEHLTLHWLQPVRAEDDAFYSKPCLYVYGLYSRHGRFYPPYTSYIPDYRVQGLFYNFEWLRN